MDSELLLCDIGNTTMKVGIANERRVEASYTLPVNNEVTADSLGLTLLDILRHSGAEPSCMRACAISSVVPRMNPFIKEAIARYVQCPALFIPDDLPVPLENRYERPNEVGADRLVGAFAARRLFPDAANLIIVDFGTAVTFDCLSGNTYLGGLIFPGPATAMSALAARTARLPSVDLDIESGSPVPGRDTATSIRHGIVFGYLAMAEGLCARLKKQLGDPVKILATGGFAAAIGRLGSVFDDILPYLLLDGLRMLYLEERSSKLFRG